jgi:hypothetical protein
MATYIYIYMCIYVYVYVYAIQLSQQLDTLMPCSDWYVVSQFDFCFCSITHMYCNVQASCHEEHEVLLSCRIPIAPRATNCGAGLVTLLANKARGSL